MLSRFSRKTLRGIAIAATVLGGLYAAARYWHHCTYPYGASHCCLKCLGFALHEHAELHDGHFPAGGNCPEASLSLV